MSKTVILYFSGSGNSKYVAELLAERLEGEAVDLVGFEGEIDVDCLGIVTACYCNDIPYLARDLLNNLTIKRADYAFYITTAQASSGYCAISVKGILESKGIALAYTKLFRMLSTFVVTVMPFVGKMESKYVSKEEASLSKIVDDVKGEKVEKIKCFSYPVRRVINKFSYFGMNHLFGVRNKSVSDACIGCGKCAQHCPCGSITLVEGKPSFDKNCTYCFGCAHICPVGAVKFGHNNIKGKKQYTRFTKQ